MSYKKSIDTDSGLTVILSLAIKVMQLRRNVRGNVFLPGLFLVESPARTASASWQYKQTVLLAAFLGKNQSVL